ncbi:MAG: 50S ribosomal protein L33 [Spirochaetes bacterium]|nr:50S ribosomal protein L33 [Spirochaetota bacterium]
MAAGKKKSETVQLQCTECKRKNYTTVKNKQNTPDKIQLKKFCRFDRKHTLHTEIKISK